MNQDPVTVKQIEWTSVLPSLHLVKALKFGYRTRTFVPAICAVLLVQLVLWLFGFSRIDASLQGDFRLTDFLQSHGNPIHVLVTTSWRMLFDTEASITSLMTVCLLLQIVSLALGIGISRAAASEFCVQERSGPIRNLKLTARRTSAAVKIAIAFLFFGILAFTPVLLVRGIVWLVGTDFSATMWPVLSWAAIPVILVWFVLLVTGPFAAAAIATDDCEPADAVSRAINYVLSHKLRVVFMVFWCLALARLSGSLAEVLLCWSTGITAVDLPNGVSQLRYRLMFGFGSENGSWGTMVQLVATAVEFAVLQSALTIGYVLLRQTEDSVPYREFRREM